VKGGTPMGIRRCCTCIRPSSRLGDRHIRQHMALSYRSVDRLEFLLVTHSGEFDLISSDRDGFLVVFDRARGHG
jgi:hypothetical protein